MMYIAVFTQRISFIFFISARTHRYPRKQRFGIQFSYSYMDYTHSTSSRLRLGNASGLKLLQFHLSIYNRLYRMSPEHSPTLSLSQIHHIHTIRSQLTGVAQIPSMELLQIYAYFIISMAQTCTKEKLYQ